jgi:hypothetical protein
MDSDKQFYIPYSSLGRFHTQTTRGEKNGLRLSIIRGGERAIHNHQAC